MITIPDEWDNGRRKTIMESIIWKYICAMKARIYILGAAALLLSACSKTAENAPTEVTVGVPEVTFPESTDGPQTTTATFTTSSPWSIQMSDTKAVPAWVHVSPMSGGPGTVTLNITADENTTPDERTAYIHIETGGVTQSITVTQPGDGTLAEGQSIYEMGPARDTIRVKLRAGTEYKVDVTDGNGWVTPQYLSRGKKFDSVAFFVAANATMDDRTASVRVSNAKGDYKAGITIMQLSGALDFQLDLNKIILPTGTVSSEDAASWVDSLFIAGFDRDGNPLFTQSISPVNTSRLAFRALPPENLIRNAYPSAKVYIVANSSANISRWPSNEQRFINRKDTAATKLFGQEGALPPLSGQVVQELLPGENKIGVNLSHITALVTFKVMFDKTWDTPPTIEKLSIGGFSSWGYLFTTKTDTVSAPRATTFNPAIAPNTANEYLFFAYEKSHLVLTVRAGGRYYQGIAPDILKRGYKYTFNMRLCEDGSCQPSSSSGHMSTVPPDHSPGVQQMTIMMKPI